MESLLLMRLLVMILVLVNISRSLDHEKSFLVQDGASYVYSIALYKGSLLLTSSNDIVQKDIETGVIQRTFRAHTNQVWSFVLTNESKMISSAFDDLVYLWDLETGAILKKIWLGSSNTQVQGLSYQGNQVFAVGRDRKVRLINLETGRVTRTISKSLIYPQLMR
jgi:WD40 repeat protein